MWYALAGVQWWWAAERRAAAADWSTVTEDRRDDTGL